jgi:hypothetical protein
MSEVSSVYKPSLVLDEDGYPVDEIPVANESEKSYFYYETKVVDKMPEQKAVRAKNTTSKLGKLTEMLKGPAVKGHEKTPKREGKFYHVDEQGRVIETTVTRAQATPDANAFSGFL